MSTKPNNTDTVPVMIPHAERVMSPTTGEWTRVSCECPLGEDHTYAEWVARFGGRNPYTD